MERHFEYQLGDIKNLILSMGGLVEKALRLAVQGIIQRDESLLNQVHEVEENINENQVRVDNACLSFLARRGPVAKDLRLILSIIKINADLERMGDQCVNMSHNGKDYVRSSVILPLDLIEHMFLIVKSMVSESLNSFMDGDAELAEKILIKDDEVDELKRKVFKNLTQYISQNTQNVEAALDLILLARNLERLGDHATNIAEDVIFVKTGKDVRHGGKFSPSK